MRSAAYILIIVFYSAINISTQAQFKKGSDKVLSADIFKGFVFRHKEQIAHLVTDHPTGFRITLDRKTYGEELWERRYNFPDVGMAFIYMDYNNPILGKSVALIPYYDFYIRKNKEAKGQLKYKVGLGLSYNTEKYRRQDNNKNNVISTDFSFGILAQVSYSYKLSDRLDINSFAALTHFSNGSIKKPNSGINVISLNFGLSYHINKVFSEYNFEPEDAPIGENFGYTIQLSGGMHESTRIGSGTYPFFVLSGFADKRLNHKSALSIGLEWFYSDALRRDVEYDWSLEEGENPDFNRIGIAFGHELYITQFSVISQIGYYLYDPYQPYNSIYIRAGLRRYFNDHIFSSLCVKSHGAKAEAAEFAIGYRIK